MQTVSDQLFGSHCTTVYQKVSYLEEQSLETSGGEVAAHELVPLFACDSSNVTVLEFLSAPCQHFQSWLPQMQ